EKTSKMFITGPKVIETVTGEKISAEDLGGARVHNTKSGNAHLSAETDEEPLDMVRKVLSYLPGNSDEMPPIATYEPKEDDDYNADLLEIVPYDTTRQYDIKKVVNEVVDDVIFFELHNDIAINMLVAFARIKGHPVGLVCNQPTYSAGGIAIDPSDNAARFIRFCDSFSVPISTFDDVTGFFPV